MSARVTGLILALAVALALLPAVEVEAQSAPPPAKEPRPALVIGNADYLVAPLRNPVNDAEDMARALRGLGFRVQML